MKTNQNKTKYINPLISVFSSYWNWSIDLKIIMGQVVLEDYASTSLIKKNFHFFTSNVKNFPLGIFFRFYWTFQSFFQLFYLLYFFTSFLFYNICFNNISNASQFLFFPRLSKSLVRHAQIFSRSFLTFIIKTMSLWIDTHFLSCSFKMLSFLFSLRFLWYQLLAVSNDWSNPFVIDKVCGCKSLEIMWLYIMHWATMEASVIFPCDRFLLTL